MKYLNFMFFSPYSGDECELPHCAAEESAGGL